MAKKTFKPVDVYVGSKVRERRLKMEMSQTALGEAIGLTFQQVQKYEKGSNRIGSSRLMQIANVLDVPPTYFFEGSPGAEHEGNKADSPDYLKRFVQSKEGDALMRAFVKVPKDLRRTISILVAKLVEHQ